ncbi:MAG: TldD/PmbA family protein, partial [Cyanobacteria bacterium RM1_2_2]|nr:TldD/PmbA family protein [Cyanobacteria bacterium RM1_2_2]
MKPIERQPTELNLIEIEQLESTFNQIAEHLLANLQAEEHLKLNLAGEQSQFVRFNGAKVRQTGCIGDGSLTLTLMRDQRNSYRSIPLTGHWQTDWPQAQAALAELRQEVP